ncbi:MAG: hypothetical protein AAF957_14480 [Planctomycetota bacterium]
MRKKRRVLESGPLEAATERERSVTNSLWAHLAGLVRQHDHRRILYTSVEAEAGTTVIAAQSVVGLVRNTRTSAALVEIDIEDPELAGYIGVESEPGLAELLEGSSGLGRVSKSMYGCPGLTVVPAGTSRLIVPGEFATDTVGDHMAKLREEHQCLFIDAPPILTHPQTRLMLEYVDGVILVLRARATQKKRLREVERLLDDMNVPIFGAVLNRYRSDMPFGLD